MKKQIEPQIVVATDSQSGTGSKESDPSAPNLETKIEDSEQSVENKIRSKLEPTIYHSFQHPRFVKTEKIRFDLKRKSSESNDVNKNDKKAKVGGSKTLKHNFQFY